MFAFLRRNLPSWIGELQSHVIHRDGQNDYFKTEKNRLSRAEKMCRFQHNTDVFFNFQQLISLFVLICLYSYLYTDLPGQFELFTNWFQNPISDNDSDSNFWDTEMVFTNAPTHDEEWN